MATPVDQDLPVVAPSFSGSATAMLNPNPPWILISISGDEPVPAAVFGALNQALAQFSLDPPIDIPSFGQLDVIALSSGSKKIYFWPRSLMDWAQVLGFPLALYAAVMAQPAGSVDPLAQCMNEVVRSAPDREVTCVAFDGKRTVTVTFKGNQQKLSGEIIESPQPREADAASFLLAERLVHLRRDEDARIYARLEPEPRRIEGGAVWGTAQRSGREALWIELQGTFRDPGTDHVFLTGRAVRIASGQWVALVDRIVPASLQTEFT